MQRADARARLTGYEFGWNLGDGWRKSRNSEHPRAYSREPRFRGSAFCAVFKPLFGSA
jgi:hypothetical protein